MQFKREKRALDPTFVVNATETWKETLAGEWTRTIIKNQSEKLNLDKNKNSSSEQKEEEAAVAAAQNAELEENNSEECQYAMFTMEELARLYRLKQKILAKMGATTSHF